MGHPPILIRRLVAGQRDRALEVLAEALAIDPLLRWACGTPGARSLRDVLADDVDEALAADELWAAGELDALAAWSRPTDRSSRIAAIERIGKQGFAASFGERGGRLFELELAAAAALPDESHRYLELLATRPAARRRGFATALLRPGLARSDREQLAVALDTSNPASVPFYESLGFTVIERLPAEGAPGLSILRRAPAAA